MPSRKSYSCAGIIIGRPYERPRENALGEQDGTHRRVGKKDESFGRCALSLSVSTSLLRARGETDPREKVRKRVPRRFLFEDTAPGTGLVFLLLQLCRNPAGATDGRRSYRRVACPPLPFHRTSSCLTSPHLISPYLVLSHLISFHLILSHHV